ncbi:MAG: cell division protein FtsA [Candidatus Taylorbacteria bacterium RIFCSPHIGHO2_01_FULL_51_15]|uniref:Cell division protein FtsA n=1 Tax=Candidatus Taylorbacteria bacterium RIFCSPHIGHO2_01_FULL_51_15 TaxID=1802304 RepID=A0A1G2MED9_9BACT|nr:MAG: cell division protein FtsA [Candidatus Taylorbacteria bacterium RIFCSPHIGHO2_01_FULL_51_15]
MSKSIAVGIDIGTYQTRVVAVESARDGERELPKVVGVGFAESRGLRHGYILSQSDAGKSVRQAVSQASKAAGFPITRAVVSIGGIGLSSFTSSGTVVITRADLEITELDVKKAIETSKEEIPASLSQNRKILHTVPLLFKVDGKAIMGKPEGLKGSKLEVRTLFITCFEHHMNDLLETLAEAGIEVEDLVAAPIAASLVTLTKQQKMAGVVLANIGSETVSIAVFENNLPISLEIFPIGSNDITNDIALGLRVPLEEAEDLKRGSVIGASYPRKKLEEIIEARLSDIFELVEAHLKKLGRSGLLPAGIVLTGGGSAIETVDDLAKASLRLPSRVASVSFGDNIRGQIKDASWSVAYGLCVLGLQNSDEETISGLTFVKQTRKGLMNFFRQFLP